MNPVKILLKMRVEVLLVVAASTACVSVCECECVRGYLVEAVHCSPPLAVRVQYFPAAVLKAHFLSSRLISIWKTSWSPSSSWLAERSIPEEGSTGKAPWTSASQLLTLWWHWCSTGNLWWLMNQVSPRTKSLRPLTQAADPRHPQRSPAPDKLLGRWYQWSSCFGLSMDICVCLCLSCHRTNTNDLCYSKKIVQLKIMPDKWKQCTKLKYIL